MPNRDADEAHLGTALTIDGDGHGAFAILVGDENFWRYSPNVHLEGDSAECDVLEVFSFEQTAGVIRGRRGGIRGLQLRDDDGVPRGDLVRIGEIIQLPRGRGAVEEPDAGLSGCHRG